MCNGNFLINFDFLLLQLFYGALFGERVLDILQSPFQMIPQLLQRFIISFWWLKSPKMCFNFGYFLSTFFLFPGQNLDFLLHDNVLVAILTQRSHIVMENILEFLELVLQLGQQFGHIFQCWGFGSLEVRHVSATDPLHWVVTLQWPWILISLVLTRWRLWQVEVYRFAVFVWNFQEVWRIHHFHFLWWFCMTFIFTSNYICSW